MPTKLSLIAAVSSSFLLSAVRAADHPARGEPRVEFDVVIAEQSAHAASGDTLKGESGEETLARIRELDAQGKLTALTRVHLSARAGGATSVQLGEKSAGGGRATAAGDRGRGDFGGGFGGRAPDPSEAGTVVLGTPDIADDGTITLELQVEKTRLEERDADGGGSSRMITISARTDVSLADGETVIAHSFDGRAQEGVAGDREQQYVIVVTAHIAGGLTMAARDDAAPEVDRKWTVYPLKVAVAAEAAKTLEELLPTLSRNIVVDLRTNSIFVAGPDDVLEKVDAFLQLLDKPLSAPPAPE